MNILFVSAILPYPLYSGGQIRMYNLLKQLSKRHIIDLFSFIRSEDELSELKHLSFCASIKTIHRGHAWQPKYVVRAITGAYPLLLTTYDNSDMRSAIAQALLQKKYDLIHIEPGYVWPSIPKVTCPLVICEHNVEHEVYEGYVRQFPMDFVKPILASDVGKLNKWEKHIWKTANRVIAVSDDDKKEIEKYAHADRVSVVPNGVDLDEFRFTPHESTKKNGLAFVFVGNFSWLQNKDAATYLLHDIWPEVLKRYPEVTLRIVGRNVPSAIQALGTHPSITFLEHVDTIAIELRASDVMLAPIRIGGGTKYKILEAMAAGLVVITTTSGAKGLLVRDGKELLIADGVEATINSIAQIIDNPTLRTRIASQARACIEKEYSWDRIALTLERVWKQAYENA